MKVLKWPKPVISPGGDYKIKFSDIEATLISRLNQYPWEGKWSLEDGFFYSPRADELDTKNMNWNNGGFLCVAGVEEYTGEVKFINLGVIMPELKIFSRDNAKGCGYAVIDGNSGGDDE